MNEAKSIAHSGIGLADVAKPFQRSEELDSVAGRAYLRWRGRCQGEDQQLQDWLGAEAEMALDAAAAGILLAANRQIAILQREHRDLVRRLRAERGIEAILMSSGSLTEAAPQLARSICECLSWNLCIIWILDAESGLLRYLDLWNNSAIDFSAVERQMRSCTFSRGVGLPGLTWEREASVWSPDTAGGPVSAETDAEAAKQHSRRIGVPLHNGENLEAVLEFFDSTEDSPVEQVIEMLDSIDSQIRQFGLLRSAQKQLFLQEQERGIAKQIQMELLPKFLPQVPGCEIGGRVLAHNLVGGDCFSVMPLIGEGNRSLSVLIADASGHGIGAALMVGQAQAFLRCLTLTCSKLSDQFELTNNSLCGDRKLGHFVTALLVRFSADGRTLEYCGAGHLPGFIFGPDGQVKSVLHSSGIPLAAVAGHKYTSASETIDAGDLILLITDGITEAASPAGELFGVDRTLATVRQYQQQSPDQIIDALFDAVSAFSDCVGDDMTAVVIKVIALPRLPTPGRAA